MANPGKYTAISTGTGMGTVAHGQFTNLSGNDFIPTLYSGQLLVKFYESSVLGAMSNTDYEGEIKSQGDSVIIRSLPTITIRDHEKGQTLVNEYPAIESLAMNIDKGRYYAFVTDDIDEAQTDIKSYISNFTSEAAYHLRNEVEKEVLSGVVPDVGLQGTVRGIDLGAIGSTANATPAATGADPVNLTKSNILDKIIECGQLLDEENVPEDGRFILLPPAFISLLKLSDLKQANLTGDSITPLRNGQVGMIDRFTIYSTNNLKADVASAASNANETVIADLKDLDGDETDVDQSDSTGAFRNCLFGHKAGISFASQMVKSESMVNPDGFGQLHRGLHVFGYKVVKPTAVGNLYARLG
tara:strand:+ start:1044 stop:2114 length:1071 start_codon:yes stop_codon:yes gene_type:complete